ncbi:MAG: DUF805 domain-containing protein [Hyphomicrobiaceae bacterium]
MVMPHYYILALINPNGRLPQVPFALLSIALAIAHLYVFAHVLASDAPMSWNIWTASLFVMLWMQFSLLSRRLRDTGSSGALLVPVLIGAASLFVVTIEGDRGAMATIPGPVGEIVRDWGLKFIRGVYLALFLYCIRAAGEDGPNGYGPEFGTTTESSRSVSQTTLANFGAAKASKIAWGERRAPDGFGRRVRVQSHRRR